MNKLSSNVIIMIFTWFLRVAWDIFVRGKIVGIAEKGLANLLMALILPTESEHLSVYQTSPEFREREAFEEELDGAPEGTGEPGKSSAGKLGRLAVRVFFSAGAGLLA